MEGEERNDNRTRLQLHVYASNLPRVGLLKTPPDTSALVSFSKDEPQESSSKSAINSSVEATEIIEKSCHPQWTTVLSMDYENGTKSFFTVYVMRHDTDKSEKECYGRAVFEVGDVLKSKQTKARTFREGGCVFVHLHPVTNPCNQEKMFRFQIYALRLEVKTKQLSDIFHNAPDTLIEISKRQVSPGGYTWITVYRSKPVNSIMPIWSVGELDLETCCNGDLHHPLRLSVWLHKQGAHETLLGMCETTVDSVLYACTHNTTDGVPDDKTLFLRKPPSRTIKDNRGVKETGKLGVKLAQILSPCDASSVSNGRVTTATFDGGDDSSFDSSLASPPRSFSSPQSVRSWESERTSSQQPQFTDYANDGLALNFFTALDFTSSNGDPRVPGTLHHRTEGSLNQYESSIKSVGEAIESVSPARDFTVWGFGAKFGGVVRHIFQCGASSAVVGVNGVLEAYRSVFQRDLIMSSPPILVNVIQAAAVQARKLHLNGASRRRYCVLLIVVTGAVKHVDETKRKLSAYSDIPLSVVIVRVGSSGIAELQPLNDTSPGSRRNVTVVEFQELEAATIGTMAIKNVQNQVVEYMVRNNMYPSSHG